MRRLAPIALLTILASMPGAPARGAAPELRALFPRQAEITASGGGLVRLVLPAEVLADCRGDLSDVRIFDAQGREVPYFVDSGLVPENTVREVRRTVTPELLSAAREEEAREGAPNLLRERYDLSAPGDPEGGGAWDLVMESRRAAFVRRVTVAAADGTLLAEGSWFRLRQPARQRLRLTLPPLAGGPMTVTLEGAEDFYLEPTFRFEASRALPPSERAEVGLEEISRAMDADRTSVELARPRGLVPDRLLVSTSTGAFHREVEVWDEGPGAVDEALGHGVVFRLASAGGPASIEELELDLSPARGDRLRLVIVDGDSPPLGDLEVRAVLRRPALLFSVAGDSATLAFGGGRAFAPHYDLAALVPPAGTLRGTDAAVGERLYDPALVGEARLGEVVANPRYDPAPVLAFAHRAGSELDARLFRFRREIVASPSPEGLVRLTLGLEDLAVARGDLADVRVVDGDGRQWAYLSEPDAGEEVRSLSVSEPKVDDGTSRFRVELPASPAIVSRLVLDVDAAFFDRDYELMGRRGKEEVTLARSSATHGRLARRIGDPRPVVIACAAEPVEELELRVSDGDDAPLVFTAVQGHFPVSALYFAAPAGRYALLLGHPEAEAPRYELERVRDLILSVASGEAEAEALGENPAYSAGARFAGDEGRQQLLLWLALGVAVVVLTVLTLRLARRGESA